MTSRHYIVLIAVLLAGSFSLKAQNITVTGTVKDEQNQPVISAGVKDMGNSKNVTITDIDGHYSITVDKSAVLEFSFLGYKTQLVQVEGKTTVNVRLLPEDTVLESAVAIGYGTAKKVDLTGSVSVVQMDEVQDTPALSVAETLQGRVAGADIISGNGEPGDGASIQIRGARSISAANQPLIVVDGVPDAVSSLDDLNPSDIVSISVLKDVSSTAIYGSRGANGVILVTTDVKPQKGAKVRFYFKTVTGFSRIAGKLDLMDANDFANWYNMVAIQKKSSVIHTPQSEGSSWPFPDPSVMGQGTDWVDALSRTGIYSGNYFQVNGSTAHTNIQASAGVQYNKGVIIGSDYTKYSCRFNIDSKIGRRVTLGLRFGLTYTNANRTNAKVSGTDTNAAIFLTPVLDKDSEWNRYAFDDASGVVFNNPYLSAINITNKVGKWNLNVIPWVKVDIIKNLYLQSNFSFTRDNDMTYYYSPSFMPLARARNQGGTATRTIWDQQRFLSETTLNWNQTFRGGHNLSAMAGFTASRLTRDYGSYSGTGFINDSAMYYNMTGIYNGANYSEYSYNTVKKTMSVLGRVNYNYKRRYYLTLTARADGASNFSEDRKWGFFPAVAFRWSLMNEPWMKRNWWLNDLALRLSAGRSGNDAISNYLSYATVDNAKGTWLFNGKFLLSTMPGHLANSHLTWETTDAYNVGVSFSGWASRVNVELDAYYSLTRDLLLSVKNSQVTGYDSYFDNLGSTRNMGVELTVTTKNIKRRKFSWDTSLTISHNSQKVMDSGAGSEVVPTFSNPRNSTQYLYGYKTGYPVNALWGYQYAGVWHNMDEVERNKYTHTYVSTIQSGDNLILGRCKYVDINGDGLLDQKDVVYLGNSDPVVYGGIQNDFTFWGKLTLNVFIAYSIGGSIYNLSELYLGSSSSQRNKYRYVLDAWDATRNPNSNLARPGWDDTLGSDRHVHDASYLRLKSVTLTYAIPIAKWSKFFRKMTVGASAENLFLLKSYNGFDPDVSTSATVRRLDNGSYPRSRTFTFNFSVNF